MSYLLLCVFIAPSCFGTIWNDLFPTKIAKLWGLTVSISLDDSATAGGAWHFCVGRLLLLRSKSGPGSYYTITVSVNWLSDKRYLCVRIKSQIGPLSRTEQKSLWPQAVFRKTLPYRIIFTSLGRWATRQIRTWLRCLCGIKEKYKKRANHSDGNTDGHNILRRSSPGLDFFFCACCKMWSICDLR